MKGRKTHHGKIIKTFLLLPQEIFSSTTSGARPHSSTHWLCCGVVRHCFVHPICVWVIVRAWIPKHVSMVRITSSWIYHFLKHTSTTEGAWNLSPAPEYAGPLGYLDSDLLSHGTCWHLDSDHHNHSWGALYSGPGSTMSGHCSTLCSPDMSQFVFHYFLCHLITVAPALFLPHLLSQPYAVGLRHKALQTIAYQHLNKHGWWLVTVSHLGYCMRYILSRELFNSTPLGHVNGYWKLGSSCNNF